MTTADPDRLAEALSWLASTTRAERGGAAVPALQRRFDLTPAEACEVIREHNLALARAL